MDKQFTLSPYALDSVSRTYGRAEAAGEHSCFLCGERLTCLTCFEFPSRAGFLWDRLDPSHRYHCGCDYRGGLYLEAYGIEVPQGPENLDSHPVLKKRIDEAIDGAVRALRAYLRCADKAQTTKHEQIADSYFRLAQQDLNSVGLWLSILETTIDIDNLWDLWGPAPKS